VLHKQFPQPLHGVSSVQINLTTQARAQVIVFSSALALPYATLIDYYGLRFQIEFTFRDAKQCWGLEAFMNIRGTAVTTAAKLSLFMVKLADVLLGELRHTDPHCSVLDLKAYYRGYTYVTETIKLLPEKPDDRLGVQIFHQVASLGRIHLAKAHLNAA
jgi:hypothetical protein